MSSSSSTDLDPPPLSSSKSLELTVVDRISIVKLIKQDRVGRKSSGEVGEEGGEKSASTKEEEIASSLVVGAEKAERRGEKKKAFPMTDLQLTGEGI